MGPWIKVGHSLPGLEGEIVDASTIENGEYGEIWGDEILADDDPRIPNKSRRTHDDD